MAVSFVLLFPSIIAKIKRAPEEVPDPGSQSPDRD
jgi:hypothetical protein